MMGSAGLNYELRDRLLGGGYTSLSGTLYAGRLKHPPQPSSRLTRRRTALTPKARSPNSVSASRGCNQSGSLHRLRRSHRSARQQESRQRRAYRTGRSHCCTGVPRIGGHRCRRRGCHRRAALFVLERFHGQRVLRRRLGRINIDPVPGPARTTYGCAAMGSGSRGFVPVLSACAQASPGATRGRRHPIRTIASRSCSRKR
jgi:hypothetical protein